jgi:hypothetical protein
VIPTLIKVLEAELGDRVRDASDRESLLTKSDPKLLSSVLAAAAPADDTPAGRLTLLGGIRGLSRAMLQVIYFLGLYIINSTHCQIILVL